MSNPRKDGGRSVNPAREVHRIVAEFTSVKENNLGKAWAKTLGAEALDSIEFFEEMAKFYRLLARAERDVIEAVEGSEVSDRSRVAMRQLRAKLNGMNFNSTASQLKSSLKPLLPQLELAADVVEMNADLPLVDDAILQNLDSDLTAIREGILASDLDERVKALLVRRLQALQAAIVEIRLRGLEDVEAAIDAAFAALAFTDAPAASPALTERIVAILRRASAAIGYQLAARMLTSEKALELTAEGAQKLLGG